MNNYDQEIALLDEIAEKKTHIEQLQAEVSRLKQRLDAHEIGYKDIEHPKSEK
jgi:uncharacterized coiled-coil protein SlyX